MDASIRKKVLRQVTYGLYIATARAGDRVAAGTINWLSQTSFDPPLVVAGIKVDSSLHKAIRISQTFAVHILGKSQKKLATAFFKTAKLEDGKLNGCTFETGKTGAPLLLDAPAWFECRVVDEVRRGDHTIFVAEVVAAGLRHDEEPLTLRETGFSYAG